MRKTERTKRRKKTMNPERGRERGNHEKTSTDKCSSNLCMYSRCEPLLLFTRSFFFLSHLIERKTSSHRPTTTEFFSEFRGTHARIAKKMKEEEKNVLCGWTLDATNIESAVGFSFSFGASFFVICVSLRRLCACERVFDLLQSSRYHRHYDCSPAPHSRWRC